MKNSYTYILLLALFTLTSAGSCRKEKTALEQLPPETQTGANTFGCLVNGQVFKPGGASLTGGSLSCNYQLLGNGLNGGYHFRLVAVNDNSSNRKSLGIFTDSLKIKSGETYGLKKSFEKGGAYGVYSFSQIQPMLRNNFETTDIIKGELFIKKLDETNQIVSGIFWFNAVTSDGQTVEVRQGRFDVRYTQ